GVVDHRRCSVVVRRRYVPAVGWFRVVVGVHGAVVVEVHEQADSVRSAVGRRRVRRVRGKKRTDEGQSRSDGRHAKLHGETFPSKLGCRRDRGLLVYQRLLPRSWSRTAPSGNSAVCRLAYQFLGFSLMSLSRLLLTRTEPEATLPRMSPLDSRS